MSPRLLDDVIPEILRRLPAKDLLRFRSVSKPWRSLIDSPNFIKLHLNTQNRGAIVMNRELFWINFDSPNSAAKLPRPLEGAAESTEMIGSSNGLLVLKNPTVGLALWNPSTRKQRKLHHLPSAEPEPEPGFRCLPRPTFDELMAFGHDPVDDDYKLVRRETFRCLQTGNFDSVFTVHSLRAKTCKRVEKLSFPTFFCKGCPVVRNAFHWIVVLSSINEQRASSPWTIFALDIGAQKFREVAKPERGTGRYSSMMVLELSGSLCLIRRYAESCVYVVWTMKEYGVKESWTKLLSVGPSEIGVPFKYAIPVEFRDGGNRVLLETGNGLALFDLRSSTVENSKISGVDDYFDMCQCAESLVTLDWAGGDVEEEKPKQSGKKSGASADTFLAKGFKLKL